MVLNYKGKHIIDWTSEHYLKYVQSRWDLRTPRMPNPTHVEGVRFVQPQDQEVTTSSPRNGIDPGQRPQNVASDQGPHCWSLFAHMNSFKDKMKIKTKKDTPLTGNELVQLIRMTVH